MDAAIPFIRVAVPERPDRLLGARGDDQGAPALAALLQPFLRGTNAFGGREVAARGLDRFREAFDAAARAIGSFDGPAVGDEPRRELAPNVAPQPDDYRGIHSSCITSAK